jgi:hypothetical protein
MKKIVNENKLLAVTLGVAGLYWATNKKLPDWLIVTTVLSTTVKLINDASQLIVNAPDNQDLGCANNPNCACNRATPCQQCPKYL